MILSILIPTIPDRADLLARLLARLEPQLVPSVEILLASDSGERSIGQKRNEMLDAAEGEYICFCDDDDLVAEDYIARILSALESRPDVVGFKLRRYVNGALRGEAIHSMRYTENRNLPSGDGEFFERMPNHLNPVRRELVLAVRFPPINQGEDTDYSKRLRPMLRTEAFIDAHLYDYLYRSPSRRQHELTNKARPRHRQRQAKGV